METAQIGGLCQDSRLPFSIDKDHERGSIYFTMKNLVFWTGQNSPALFEESLKEFEVS